MVLLFGMCFDVEFVVWYGLVLMVVDDFVIVVLELVVGFVVVLCEVVLVSKVIMCVIVSFGLLDFE